MPNGDGQRRSIEAKTLPVTAKPKGRKSKELAFSETTTPLLKCQVLLIPGLLSLQDASHLELGSWSACHFDYRSAANSAPFQRLASMVQHTLALCPCKAVDQTA